MMNEKDIVEVLKANEKIADFEIIKSNKESSELFFVLKKLELNRATNTENISINVYVDLKGKRRNVEFEIIPSWRNENDEFELYKYYESNKLNEKEITEEVNNWLLLARDRSVAIKPSNLDKNIPILLQGEMNDLIVETIESNSDYMSSYLHTNHFNVGDEVASKFDLTLKANIDGCFKSSYFDYNGVALSFKKLIKEGKLIDNYGDFGFGEFLYV